MERRNIEPICVSRPCSVDAAWQLKGNLTLAHSAATSSTVSLSRAGRLIASITCAQVVQGTPKLVESGHDATLALRPSRMKRTSMQQALATIYRHHQSVAEELRHHVILSLPQASPLAQTPRAVKHRLLSSSLLPRALRAVKPSIPSPSSIVSHPQASTVKHRPRSSPAPSLPPTSKSTSAIPLPTPSRLTMSRPHIRSRPSRVYVALIESLSLSRSPWPM